MAKRGQAVRRSPTRSKVPTKPKGAPADVDLKKEIATLKRELAEALERQTATSEVSKSLAVRLATLSQCLKRCWRMPRASAKRILGTCGSAKVTHFGLEHCMVRRPPLPKRGGESR